VLFRCRVRVRVRVRIRLSVGKLLCTRIRATLRFNCNTAHFFAVNPVSALSYTLVELPATKCALAFAIENTFATPAPQRTFLGATQRTRALLAAVFFSEQSIKNAAHIRHASTVSREKNQHWKCVNSHYRESDHKNGMWYMSIFVHQHIGRTYIYKYA